MYLATGPTSTAGTVELSTRQWAGIGIVLLISVVVLLAVWAFSTLLGRARCIAAGRIARRTTRVIDELTATKAFVQLHQEACEVHATALGYARLAQDMLGWNDMDGAWEHVEIAEAQLLQLHRSITSETHDSKENSITATSSTFYVRLPDNSTVRIDPVECLPQETTSDECTHYFSGGRFAGVDFRAGFYPCAFWIGTIVHEAPRSDPTTAEQPLGSLATHS